MLIFCKRSTTKASKLQKMNSQKMRILQEELIRLDMDSSGRKKDSFLRGPRKLDQEHFVFDNNTGLPKHLQQDSVAFRLLRKRSENYFLSELKLM